MVVSDVILPLAVGAAALLGEATVDLQSGTVIGGSGVIIGAWFVQQITKALAQVKQVAEEWLKSEAKRQQLMDKKLAEFEAQAEHRRREIAWWEKTQQHQEAEESSLRNIERSLVGDGRH